MIVFFLLSYSTFSLVWHPDVVIQKACLDTFWNVFLTDGDSDDPCPKRDADVAMDLLLLCKQSSLSVLTSVERILAMYQSGRHADEHKLPSGVISIIWEHIKVL